MRKIILIACTAAIAMAASWHDTLELALKLEKEGKYREALKPRQELLDMSLSKFDQTHPDISKGYNNLGYLYDRLGWYVKAREYYERALDIAIKVHGIDNVDTAVNYGNVGSACLNLADYDCAFNYYSKALFIRQKTLGDHVKTAISYHNLGMLYDKMGEYDKALEHYKKALFIRIKLLGERDPATANTYNSLGSIYLKLNDYNRALQYHQKALAINEEVSGKQHPTLAINYNNLGATYEKLKEYKKSLKYHEKALILIKNTLGKKHPSIANSYRNIGLVYEHMKDRKRALEHLNKALNLSRKLLGETHPDTAISYNNLGAAYSRLGDNKRALGYFQTAIGLQENVLGAGHPDMAYSYGNVSHAHFELKNYAKSYEYVLKAYQIYKADRDRNFGFLSGEQKRAYIKANGGYIAHMLGTADKMLHGISQTKRDAISSELFGIWINDKGVLLDSENTLSMLKALSKDENLTAHIDRLNALKRDYARLAAFKSKPDEAATNEARIKELNEQIGTIEIGLAKLSVKFNSELGTREIAPADVAKYLKQDELFIDFGYLKERYYVFSIDGSGKVKFNTLNRNESKIIDDGIAVFRSEVEALARDGKQKKLGTKSSRELGKIYALLFERALANRTKDYESLVISPDGVLRLLPFEALLDTRGYLVQSKRLRYTASAKEFVRAHKFNNVVSREPAALFSDPAYDLPADANVSNLAPNSFGTELNLGREALNLAPSTRAGVGIFTSLRGFREEENAIKSALDGINVYHGQSASESNVMQLNSPKILHITTHGFFINDENIINPMLKSGIALTGANSKSKEGVVTALKLSGLNLVGTDLVVLSACETGVVSPRDTYGVAALPKTFIQAGAKNVMMSLWKVDDVSTVRLMREFYEGFKFNESNINSASDTQTKINESTSYSGESKEIEFSGGLKTKTNADTDYHELLRRSKLAMIKDGLHPYYWAGFIISGE